MDPYDEGDDACDHDYEKDHETLEFACVHCGDRVPMDLTDLIR